MYKESLSERAEYLSCGEACLALTHYSTTPINLDSTLAVEYLWTSIPPPTRTNSRYSRAEAFAMPNENYGNILGRLSATCSFPTEGELEDDTCRICLRTSLKAQGDEVPTKLGCGHVFGMSCLLNWTSASFAQGQTSPTCPVCRAPFLTEASRFRSAQQIETENLSRLFLDVDIRQVGNSRLSGAEEGWIDEAERLWAVFCREIVDSLYDLHRNGEDILRDIPAAVSRFELCQTLAETLLSYDKVYNFYQAYCHQDYEFEQNMRLLRWWEDLFRIRGLAVPDTYGSLIAYLDTADAGLMRNWRVSRAFRKTQDDQMDTEDDDMDAQDNQMDLITLAQDMRGSRSRFLDRVAALRQA